MVVALQAEVEHAEMLQKDEDTLVTKESLRGRKGRWNVKRSVFANRPTEVPCQDFFDTPEVNAQAMGSFVQFQWLWKGYVKAPCIVLVLYKSVFSGASWCFDVIYVSLCRHLQTTR